MRTVAIGGINAATVQRVLYQSSAAKKLDGVAVVSAIVAAKDPKLASTKLINLIRTHPPFAVESLANDQKTLNIEGLVQQVPDIIRAVKKASPLSHNMINLVVQNFAANVALSIGGSPIMANFGDEASDLCKLGGSLVINSMIPSLIGLMRQRCANMGR